MVNTVFIELTNNCNCRCRSCPQSIGLSRPRGYMDFDLFKKVINQAWQITDVVNFSFFGEPTLHPQFIECMEYLRHRQSGKEIIIFSNFLCMTQKMIDALISVRPKRVHISINAATSETYNQIRSGQHHTDLNGNILININRFETLCDKVKHWFSITNHPPTRHEFVVASYSAHELKQFVQIWLPFLGPNDEILTKGILSYGGIMLNDPFLTSSLCQMWGPQNYLVVDWEGDVSPCFLDNGMRLTIGSIFNDSLQDINKSERRQNVKDQSIDRKIKPCDTCMDASHGIKTRIYRLGSQWQDSHIGDWK